MGLIAAGITAVGSIAGGLLSSGIFNGGGGSIPDPKLQGVDLQDPSAAFAYYTQQSGQFPAVAAFTNRVNQTDMQQYTQMLNQLYPGATTQLGDISKTAGQYIRGQIPSDVQAAVQRATAQQANAGGYAGTGMATNLTARDFGRTSTDLINTGIGMYQGALGTAASMIPGYINPGQLLFSPAQLLARQDQKNYYNNEVYNQEQLAKAGIQMNQNMMQMAQQAQQNSALGGMVSNLFGSGGKSNNLANQLGNWASNLGNPIGSGWTSGGGLSFSTTGDVVDTASLEDAFAGM